MTIEFDGGNDTIRGSDITIGTSDFTIWSIFGPYSGGSDARLLYGKERSGVAAYQFRFFMLSGDELVFMLSNSDNSDSLFTSDYTLKSSALTEGVFHSVAVTRDGTDYELYVDGSLSDTASTSTTIDHNNSYRGAMGNLNGDLVGTSVAMYGQIDCMRYYTRKLSAAEIREMDFSLDRLSNVADLKFHYNNMYTYPLNAPSGTGVIKDLSPSGDDADTSAGTSLLTGGGFFPARRRG